MKKIVFASVMALASISLMTTPMLRAQDSDTISVKDPAELNTYNSAIGLSDPKAKAPALEGFLTAYPQSVLKKLVLDQLIDTAQALGDADKTLSAASRLLQVDPNNMKAIYYSVVVKKSQCGRTQDVQTCDDAALLAHKGLLASKPAGTSDADWKKLTGGSYPLFHSAIASDDAIAKKDFKGAIAEYTAELMLYTDDQSKTAGLQDTYFLAVAYSQPSAKDLVKAIWFFARAWNFVPTGNKPTVEKLLDYYYKQYHGDLKGLDDIKAQAALTTFPPGTLKIDAAPTPSEIAHSALIGGDPAKLNLGDKEYILANGVKEDADKLWAVLKDQITPVPGIVIDATVLSVKVSVSQAGKTGPAAKPSSFVVNLKAPTSVKDIPASADFSTQKAFILTSGVVSETDKLTALLNDDSKGALKVVIEPTVSVVKVAVTDDAKTAKVADFIVNLKKPLEGKEIPAVNYEYKIPPATSLVGTYSSYSQVAATATTAQAALIVLSDGEVQLAEQKKPAAPAHKPAAGRPAAH